ncbi:MAG: DUF4147 domain-containing protein [bacterium]|nr:DUF4147 domain-containing protein [bacterium]
MSGAVDLRADARVCLDAAVRAVEPERLVRDALAGDEELLSGAGRVHLAAVGKAAAAMARGAADVLADRLAGGVLVAPEGQTGDAPAGVAEFAGGHPIPNERGVEGAGEIRRLAADLGAADLLLALISGGGSALMTLPPPGVSLVQVQETTDALLRSGATIQELNCVRKHLDLLKGGRLAKKAHPARVLALVLSDVVGDPLDVIASGPVTADPTTFYEALEILKRFGVWSGVPALVRDYLERGEHGEEAESPKPGDPELTSAEARIVGSNRMAAEAALAEARDLGYTPHLVTTRLTGEARQAGKALAGAGRQVQLAGRPVAPPACLVAAGETTVTVRGTGRGGRNQEVALGAALALEGSEGILVASMGTDGIDGPTDAAGAVADGDTLKRARAQGLDAGRALADNDAYPFFQALGDLLVTGPTGTNVMDVALVLVR